MTGGRCWAAGAAAFFIAAGCARLKVTTTGLYEMPLGGWTRQPVVDTVRRFGPAPGAELGISFGENITSFEIVGKYIPFNTSRWLRYPQQAGDSLLDAHARAWAVMAGLGIEFPVKKFTPAFGLRLGYLAAAGSETYRTPTGTYVFPYTFLRNVPAANISVGLSLPPLKFVRFTPKVEYTFAPAIQYPSGPRPGWMSVFEAGLGVDFHLLQPRPVVEVEKELALRIREREHQMSQSYFSQGVTYYNLTKYLEALNSLDLSLIWNPDNSSAEEWVGRAKRAKEDAEITILLEQADRSLTADQYVETMRAVQEVLAIDSTHPKALEMKRRAELGFTGQVDREKSGEVKQHLDAGKNHYLKGEYNGAIREWSQVLALVPANDEVKQYLVWAQGKRKEAIEQNLARVDALMKEEQWDQAIGFCQRVLVLDSTNLQASELKRISQRRLGEREEALLSQAATALQTGDVIKAEDNSRAVLRINPLNADAQNYLNKVKDKKMKMTRNEISDLYLKGIDAYTKNQFESAIFFWTKVLQIEPTHVNARKNLERAKAKRALSRGG